MLVHHEPHHRRVSGGTFLVAVPHPSVVSLVVSFLGLASPPELVAKKHFPFRWGGNTGQDTGTAIVSLERKLIEN